MTDLNKMWTELERYQPFADKRGFGDAWRRMTAERTEEAAAYAATAAWATAAWATAGTAAAAAAWAIYVTATKSVEWERNSAVWVQRAINDIRTAIKREEQT